MKLKWKSKKTNSLVFLSNLFFYKVESKNSQTQNKLKPIWFHILILFFLAVIIFTFSKFDYKLNSYFGFQNFYKNVFKFFQIKNESTYLGKTNLALDSLSYLWVSIKYAIVGTFIGFVIAIFTAFLSSSKLNNFWLALIIKNLILLIRSIPELLFITLFNQTFFREFALILIYLWFSWLWLHKYFLETIESLDLTTFYVSKYQGNSSFYAFRKEILSRLWNKFIVLFLYSFESNIRWVSILSALGAPGIGVLINYAAISSNNIDQLAIPLIFLFLFIVFIELFNYFFNKYILEWNSKTLKTNDYQKLAKTFNYKSVIKLLFFSAIAIFSIYQLITINKDYLLNGFFSSYLNNFFKPDWSVFNISSNSISLNPFLQIFQIYGFALATLVICLFVTFWFLPFISKNNNNVWSSLFVKFLNIFLRIFPSLVLFYVFSNIVFSPATLLVFVIGITASSSLNKQLSEVIDNLDNEVIQNLKYQGYSKFKIFFSYILPSIKVEFFLLAMFYFEIFFRSSITYSFLANDGLALGSNMYFHLQEKSFNPNKAFAYMWVIVLNIFFINNAARILKLVI
ncbi:PhnE/PtxC family ABC transporter permease [Mycoplasmopsis synoviae]|uniref:PhnE/PtxC family ABC transporter permease n=1 Tax=Mycoplasmopsis synoviae TaxID=2109 RepID=UPI001CE11598|nr:ABC transporter permease subunit [Mycoplasmopsis synoviae]UBX97706.1 ABC transporter permease subunit [Mycoplasmopsis synoviae]UBX97887.1 ABC transporter permease subunit [Mycoplasmopsis synoviae]UBX98743.1 ABC transporter permease subunit [Mycoplasmopsis synoviae]UBX99508.1 ABC transporter permease subunit [Mycoplasmopsis synoviae]UBX99850.1 ABC transporter permease subunit [Mycoplasmopsis synoviae]